MWSRPRRLAAAGLLFVLLGLPAAGAEGEGGQLSGDVRHAESGEPLPMANVFLAHTLLGTSTDAWGRFHLEGIPPGHYHLVVSMVGFRALHEEIDIAEGAREARTFLLQVRELVAEEIQVEGLSPVAWRRTLPRFLEAFLGRTENASDCAILNPHVINFRRDSLNDRLIAWSDSALVVENRALGYRLSILLETFSWDTDRDEGRYSIFPRFTSLSARSQEEAERWQKNRVRTHEGSLRHFLAALLRDALDDSLFALYSGPLDELRAGNGLRVGGEEIERLPGLLPRTTRISFAGWLRVDYCNVIPTAHSYVKMEGMTATIDSRGNLLTPFALMVGGEWAKRRVADLLPIDAR
jgi:hypothetical protein